MGIFLVLLFLICIYNIKFIGKQGFYSDYMSIEKTSSIKGIFILLVFSRHLTSYVDFNGILDGPFVIFDKYIGQLIVTMFLFYSGYGIMESIKKNEEKYINDMPVRRVLKLLFQFDIAVLLFLIVDYIIGKNYGLETILLSFLGWESIGNSNWYIFCILALYVITYIVFVVFKGKHIEAIIGVAILSLFYIYVMSDHKGGWWYNTILCYPAGMWYSYYRTKIENFVMDNNRVYIFSLIIIIGLFFVAEENRRSSVFAYEVWSLGFTGIVVLFTMKFSVNNFILYWLGVNLFSLYILQRIPMIILRHYKVDNVSIYLYTGLCLILTLLLGYVFSALLKKLDNLFIFKGIKRTTAKL